MTTTQSLQYLFQRKRTIFEWACGGLLGPKFALGCQKHVDEVAGVCQEAFSNLVLATEAFLNLATRWQLWSPDLYLILW